MDIFDFEELTADMLGITDEQRDKDNDYLPDEFYKKFNIDFDTAYELARHLLMHTIPVQAGLSKKYYHAFVSKDKPFMLMKVEAKAATQ